MREKLGLEGESAIFGAIDILGLHNNTLSFARHPHVANGFTNQLLSYYLDSLCWIGNTDMLQTLDLEGQKEITSLDLASFQNIELINLSSCTKLKHIILGDAGKLKHIDGLKDLSGVTCFCAKFDPNNTRLAEAFVDAQPGTIICTKWNEMETADGENVNKTLTPLGGYRKTNGGSWEKVTWGQATNPWDTPAVETD
ncbi:MAG: hypothetical protein LBS68_00895 [Puniceicoccales bacterium]|jgi:hypothetical protein|nr:hypothetical protein [Puniceicoccales bacterium]